MADILRVEAAYAFRSLWRNRRRAVLTIATVAISVCVSLIASSYAQAVLTLWENATCDHGAGHAQVHRQGYWENPDSIDSALTMGVGDPLEREMAKDADVSAFARRMRVEGIVSTGENSIYFMGIGVEAQKELAVAPKAFDPLTDVGNFVSDAIPEGVVVGKGMSETLGLRLGDEMTLIARTAQGSVNGIDVRVIGIVNFPIPSLSKRILYMNLSHMQRLIRLKDRYSEMTVRLREPQKLGTWTDERRALVSATGSQLQTWWEIEPVIRDVERIWYTVVAVIAILLFVSAGISVLNIIYVTVAERTVEIGTLMALGSTPRYVKRLFSIEAAFIGMLGALSGVLFAAFVIIVLGLVGVPFDSPYGGRTLLVYPEMHLGVTIVVGIFAVLICAVAAVPPARRASQVDPVQAFRGQVT